MLDPTIEAKKVLDNLWKNKGFPVDPVAISKLMGIDVLDTELPESVSGALIKEAGKDPVIVLHHQDSNNRKRFSCSHELGHYIYRTESDDLSQEYEYIEFRGPSSSTGTDSEEIFANQFAANLLMPHEAIIGINKGDISHYEMALHFGVSAEALKLRLKNLRLL